MRLVKPIAGSSWAGGSLRCDIKSILLTDEICVLLSKASTSGLTTIDERTIYLLKESEVGFRKDIEPRHFQRGASSDQIIQVQGVKLVFGACSALLMSKICNMYNILDLSNNIVNKVFD